MEIGDAHLIHPGGVLAYTMQHTSKLIESKNYTNSMVIQLV